MIKTNLKEKIFESGIDIGSSEIKCTIVEIDSINESVKLIGIGRSKTKGLKKGSISNREKLIDEIEASINAAELMANRKIDKVKNFKHVPSLFIIYSCLVRGSLLPGKQPSILEYFEYSL